MRIDSSGNLLVGKLSASTNTVGVEARADGTFAAVKSGGGAAVFGRNNSDGDIITVRKDGSYVGSIGNAGSNSYFSNGDTGLLFASNVDAIIPTNSGATRDNAIDLGNSGNRFKDLYLSGGVYLGGTGGANLLEDYEEGTWNPVVTGSSTAGSMNVTDRLGRYTKVGRLVTLHFYFDGDSGTGSGNLLLGGVPFTIAPHHFAFGSPQWNTGISYPSNGRDANWLRFNSTSFDIRCNMNNAGFTTVAYSSSVEYLRGCITYETDA